MKKLFMTVATFALLSAGFLAAPASADSPEPFPDTVTFPAENPCTGQIHEVTINVMVRIHEHQNNFVIKVDRTGTTSDGFVMRSGTETQHYNPVSQTAGAHFKDFWTNPETGQKFHVRGNSNVVLGNGPDAPPTEVKVDNFSLRCVRS